MFMRSDGVPVNVVVTLEDIISLYCNLRLELHATQPNNVYDCPKDRRYDKDSNSPFVKAADTKIN